MSELDLRKGRELITAALLDGRHWGVISRNTATDWAEVSGPGVFRSLHARNTDANVIAWLLTNAPALLARIDDLQRWKDEAAPLLMDLQDLGKALGLPLGASTTSPEAAKAARALRDRAEKAEAAVERVRATVAKIDAVNDLDLIGTYPGDLRDDITQQIDNALDGDA